MKYIYIILAFAALYSCDNYEITHPDFDHTAGYFPYQFPVRTLILGDYIYDNSNDNAHKFLISVAMGGVYENTKDRKFTIKVDESLADNVLFNPEGDTIQLLPRDYYTLSSEEQIIIPRDKFYGSVEVQLTDKFFSDPKSIGLEYVVPIRLEDSNDVDSILNGSSSNPNADPRIAADWTVAPKDFTMFAIKFINEYHGTYFQFGENTVRDSANNVLEENIYSEQYIVNNSTTQLVTIGRNEVSLTSDFQSDTLSGAINMILNFEGDNITISAPSDSPYTISGTGEFKKGAYEWGNKSRNGIEISYTVSDGKNTYEAEETLVARDRGVVLEEYSPVVYQE